MSFDPYAELGIPRFVPTPALPKKVKSQVVAEKKAEVKKKVIVKRAKEKVKKIVLARKLKGGRRTKQEMSEARGMGMEDKIVQAKDWRGRPVKRRGISAKELMKKGVMRAKKGQWNKMLEEIPLKERIQTIIQPLLDSGDITEGGETQYYMKRLGRYAPFFSQQVLDKYERGATTEDLTDTGYKQEKRTSLFTLTDKVEEAGEHITGGRGEVSFPKFKALHPEIFKKLNKLFGNASTRELRKLAVNMPSQPTKNDMINEVINFVVFNRSRYRLSYGFKPGEGGADTEGTERREGWVNDPYRSYGSRDTRRDEARYSGKRTLEIGTMEAERRVRTAKTKFLERRTFYDDDDDDDGLEEVESAPETDSDFDYNEDTDEEERDKVYLLQTDDEERDEESDESDLDFY